MIIQIASIKCGIHISPKKVWSIGLIVIMSLFYSQVNLVHFLEYKKDSETEKTIEIFLGYIETHKTQFEIVFLFILILFY